MHAHSHAEEQLMGGLVLFPVLRTWDGVWGGMSHKAQMIRGEEDNWDIFLQFYFSLSAHWSESL